MAGDHRKIKFGISPINWSNEDILTLGDHYTFETITNEMSALGFVGTENSRKFPQDPDVLKTQLQKKGLCLASQWKGVQFTDLSMHEQELGEYRNHVEFLFQMGCKHVVTCEVGDKYFSGQRSYQQTKGLQLSSEEWSNLAIGLNKAGEICKEYDMALVYHHHMATVIECSEEIDRLLEMTDPESVHLLFDTGHSYFGGGDPLELLRKHKNRIKYVHFKDVRQDVLDQVRKDGADFLSTVVKGVFTVPGDGCIDFKPIVQELIDLNYKGWIIIEAEQDPSVANPYQYAKKSKEYIESIFSLCEVQK